MSEIIKIEWWNCPLQRALPNLLALRLCATVAKERAIKRLWL
jgi:hypothetical protein